MVTGRFQLEHRDLKSGRTLWIARGTNLRMHTAGAIMARCLSIGNGADYLDYRTRAIYLEYRNLDNPEDEISTPEVLQTDTVDYYTELSGSSDGDYVRILSDEVSFTFDVDPDYADLLDEDQGNRLTISYRSTAEEGVHGKPFAESSNSKVCGVAVAAAPYPDDPTRDILYARGYYDGDNQKLKRDGAAFSGFYQLTFATIES